MQCKDCLYFKRCVVLGVELDIKHDKEAEKNCRHFTKKTEWIDVNERLPDREGSYLVCINHCGEIRMQVMILLKYANGFDWDIGLDSRWKDFNTITHWMPLPEPPEAQ